MGHCQFCRLFRIFLYRSASMFSLMCGRFSIAVRIGIFARRFRITGPLDFALPRYNIAPSENVPVIVTEGLDNKVSMMRWGLIPSWSDGAGQGPNPINARAEGLAESRMYQDLLKRGRCLVPATGFYEWRTSGRKKTPFYFSKKDNSLFTIAGLFDVRKDREGVGTRSFTLVTTTPNDLVAPFHDRMPAILTPEGEETWASRNAGLTADIGNLFVPFPSGEMEAFEVSQTVNNPSNKTVAAVTRVRQETLDGY
jgi:putative SOS response-associated peptidase YedK